MVRGMLPFFSGQDNFFLECGLLVQHSCNVYMAWGDFHETLDKSTGSALALPPSVSCYELGFPCR